MIRNVCASARKNAILAVIHKFVVGRIAAVFLPPDKHPAVSKRFKTLIITKSDKDAKAKLSCSQGKVKTGERQHEN